MLSKRLIRISCAVFFSVFLCAVSTAGPVGKSRAEHAAQRFAELEKHRQHKRSRKAIQTTQAQPAKKKHRNTTTISDNNSIEPLAYIVELEPEGFIVISADDSIRPVIAYCDKGKFPTTQSQDNILLNMLRRDMKNRIAAMSSGAEFVDALALDSFEQWDLLNANDSNLLITAASTSYRQWPDGDDDGWLDTTWHQGNPAGGSIYNTSCPPDPITPTNKCYAGCVAIVMAQVVNYHEYPQDMVFDDGDNYISRADFVEPERELWIDVNPDGTNESPLITQYEYDPSMWNIDYNANGVHPLDQTISDLIFGCGVFVRMDYSDEGSGASSTDIAPAFIVDMGYGSADTMDPNINADFFDVLRSNMKNAQPAILSIRDGSDIGHAIVCDGYRDNGMYHLNYGWGSADPCEISQVWYSLPGDMPAGYNTIRRGIVNIHPDASIAGSLCSETLADFARFAMQWQLVGFPLEADLSGDEDVDYEDLWMFNERWLEPCTENIPLSPN